MGYTRASLGLLRGGPERRPFLVDSCGVVGYCCFKKSKGIARHFGVGGFFFPLLVKLENAAQIPFQALFEETVARTGDKFDQKKMPGGFSVPEIVLSPLRRPNRMSDVCSSFVPGRVDICDF